MAPSFSLNDMADLAASLPVLSFSQTVGSAIDAAFDAGCYTVRLQTGGTRPGTLDFYRSCGFDLTKHGLEVRRIPPR